MSFGNAPIDLDLSKEIAEGTYANSASIAHSTTEFVIDFMRILPCFERPKVVSRIVMTPEQAKRLIYALQENVRKFEELNGEIYIQESSREDAFPGIVRMKVDKGDKGGDA